MDAATLARLLFDLASTIDECVHGPDYLDPEIDQLVEAFRKLTNLQMLLVKHAAFVDARPDADRAAAGDLVTGADAALRTADGKDERRRAIAKTFEVGPALRALLPLSRLL